MMSIYQKNADSPWIARIDTDGKERSTHFLIRVIREIRGSVSMRQMGPLGAIIAAVIKHEANAIREVP